MMSSSRRSRTKVVVAPVTTVVPAKVGRRVARRRTNRQTNPTSTNSGLLSDYVGTLNDPFDVAPPKLGYGTFLETSNATAFKHGTIQVNADGTCSFLLCPSVSQLVSVNNSGTAGTTWTAVAATNYVQINNDGYEMRVVSGGIRTCPLVASTSVPGLVYAGTTSGLAYSALITYSSTDIAAMPSSHIGLATYGATGLLRPLTDRAIDPTQVQTQNITGMNWSNIMVTYQGLPAGTQIAWEAVLNIELIPSGGYAGAIATNRTSDPGLSGPFPVYSSLFNRIRSLLSDPIHLDFNEGGPASTGSKSLSSSSVPRASMFSSRNARSARGRLSQLNPGVGAMNMGNLATAIHRTHEATGQTVQDPYEESLYERARRSVIPLTTSAAVIAGELVRESMNRRLAA